MLGKIIPQENTSIVDAHLSVKKTLAVLSWDACHLFRA